MWKKFLTAFLAVTLLLVPSIGSFAAEDTYKVTISSGMQGKFEDESDKLVYEVEANGTFEFTASTSVILNAEEDGSPSKYYIKGVRLSGRDDAVIYTTLLETIQRDTDYVVVYGIKGDQVEYTVRYVNKNGEKLAENDVFYGNIGDKPVVACKYIAGYAPQALTLEKTLTENAEKNVFTFIYDTSTITHYKSVTRYVDEGVVTVPGGSAAGSAGTGAGTGEDETEEVLETETGEEAAVDMPEEIIDLDDEETPLGNMDLEGVKEGLPMAGMVAIAAGSLAVLIALILFLVKKKREAGVEEE